MNIGTELEEIVKSTLEKHKGVFLVESKHGKHLHEFILDGDTPLGIYDVSGISREINKLADEKMPEEKYGLEISSPGADSPLKLLRQFPKHIGREFNVILTDGTSFDGTLKQTESDELVFEKKNSKSSETVHVKYSDIKIAKIILSFK